MITGHRCSYRRLPKTATENRDENEHPVTRTDRLSQGGDLAQGQNGSLRRPVETSALDPAGVPAQEPVISGGIQDGPEKPIRLRGACRASPDVEHNGIGGQRWDCLDWPGSADDNVYAFALPNGSAGTAR